MYKLVIYDDIHGVMMEREFDGSLKGVVDLAGLLGQFYESEYSLWRYVLYQTVQTYSGTEKKGLRYEVSYHG